MKRIVLIVTAVLILGVMGCEPIARTERPDLPDYTADQVILVAQARYPSYTIYSGNTITPSISVEYVGESLWKVVITSPSRWVSSITLYFNETTGALSLTQPD